MTFKMKAQIIQLTDGGIYIRDICKMYKLFKDKSRILVTVLTLLISSSSEQFLKTLPVALYVWLGNFFGK
jgi:hypothetical protein